MKLDKIIDHFYGLSGQISSGLPLLMITSIISKNIGIEEAGNFVILVAIISTLYTVSLWGLRPMIIIDNYQSFRKQDYIYFRIYFFILLIMTTISYAALKDIQLIVLFVILLYKISDGFIDLNFGFAQQIDSSNALRELFNNHSLKFLLFLGTYIYLFLNENQEIFALVFFTGLITLALIIYRLFKNFPVKINLKVNYKNIVIIFKKSSAFAVSASICAFLTGSPRFFLDNIYSGELMGVVAICLSIGTLFGMVFNTTWARHFPNYRNEKKLYFGIRFILENFLLLILLILLCLKLIPYLASIFFNFNITQHLEVSQFVLIGCAVFNFGMSILNLFKITKYPIFESLSYLIGLSIICLFTIFFPSTEIYFTLIFSGISMLILGLISLAILSQSAD